MRLRNLGELVRALVNHAAGAVDDVLWTLLGDTSQEALGSAGQLDALHGVLHLLLRPATPVDLRHDEASGVGRRRTAEYGRAAGVRQLEMPTGRFTRIRHEPCLAEMRGSHLERPADRKSTRLNSSHRCISYAVFCLKKKICELLARWSRPACLISTAVRCITVGTDH